MQILYFAWLRQRTGVAEETVSPPPEVTTIGALIAWLAQRGPGHAAAFADPAQVRAALDQEMCGPDTPLGAAREVAFFPPVTGG
ncbi:molybdopterin synthase subunit MoaD [Humitalea rosea]|uniref:Molybdopterin synthase sulfur carrier subunit n=1 Tax=Humitalea rosea TaxID=990373 RepID=A0A2W7J0K4_9PROT|nr:molybdopterin converting factor subunit 1 [Humitalea rosea]PZW45131.1 molybdopterin synthase subunit MoaD [Humitalea rosea]